MSDFTYDFNYDLNYPDSSTDWGQTSTDLWSTSITMSQIGDEFWVNGETQIALQFYDFNEILEDYSIEAYQQSWDAYYGPVNAEGYTAYHASVGYSATDTSFIEPSTSAGSMSMISDNSASDYF